MKDFAVPPGKQCLVCECVTRTDLNEETVSLEFAWAGSVPGAGQFFLIKPERTSVFLGRPISAAGWNAAGILRFIILKKGRGTEELAALAPGERAELSGPLGNCWADAGAFEGPAALVSGGVGVAPLACYAREWEGRAKKKSGSTGFYPECFDFYAGFKGKSYGLEGVHPRALVIASENGDEGHKGRIPDFFSPAGYGAVFSCGPLPMLKAVAALCKNAEVPCFVSMEKHMACGVGACLGCTVKTRTGNKRCCADGPIFNATELDFD